MPPSELYIVRHGIAEDEHPDHPGDDSARRLTERGRERVSEGARGMIRLGVRPDVIWTSPYRRALETAALLDEVLCPPGGLIEEPRLAFTGTVGRMIDAVTACESADRLMLVGHNPMLSDLAAELVSDGRLRVRLKKASLVHVALHRLPRGLAGELLHYAPPRALRLLAD